ncbi:hypothetical protein [Dactylosporangium sp. NPDC006015]|uniref:hypothetical protein n=1 Tax=Dactylosporangium sp. NPDC006015 TaxID=3154576 RepID=UPI0033BB736E
MHTDARRPASRWLIAVAVLAAAAMLAVITVVLVVAFRSGPRKLPEPRILRYCSDPATHPPASRCAGLQPTSALQSHSSAQASQL